MNIYQPMLFVGLGGTGCLVGAELERRLREELCGPDGTALADRGRREPFQLPECLQFVYSDFSEAELNRLPHLSVDPIRRPAYARTARATHGLLPRYSNSPEATQMLRIAFHDEVDWLPPREGEPRVSPLKDGAGQLPTVGRAALFATLRDGLTPVLTPLAAAIDRLALSAADLRALGGRRKVDGVDVFVAFSVAGGTGAGIFYDYLHLISEAFREKNLTAKIYPLVVMPTAFPAERGGGREAELNAGRALIDLFRLVDDQNSPEVAYELGMPGADGGVSVLYPGGRVLKIPSSTVQTAFLFSRTVGVRPPDLRRSIVSLVMSLLGTDVGDKPRNRAEDDHHSFADSFINKATRRSARSPSGIGHRGVSTGLVASMTVPVNELAELLAGRLLARAVRQLTDPAHRVQEDNAALVRQMFEVSGIADIWTREPLPISPDPSPGPRGGTAIATALGARSEEMLQLLDNLDRVAARATTDLAKRFNPRQGVLELLKDNDLFRVDRVLNGRREDGRDDEDVDPVAAAGFVGMLLNRRTSPGRPPGVEAEAPRASRIKGKLLGLVRARWTDPDVVEIIEEQDAWYRWRARRVWHAKWAHQENRWRPIADSSVGELAGIVQAFREHEAGEAEQFARRRNSLYLDRVGVSYLLPARADLKEFYTDVVERLRRQAGLPDGEDEAGLLLELVDHGDWQRAVDLGIRDPGGAVTTVKAVIEQRIKRLFTESGAGGERPLLPSLSDLLAGAAGDVRAAGNVDPRMRRRFEDQIAGLLPGGFVPEGTGPLTVLISYPETQVDDNVRRFLADELVLPPGEVYQPDFRPGSDHSITVVLSRSEMSLSEVPEVRKVLQVWARARREPGQEDYLAWRQRTGWTDDWLASTRNDRVHILHRLLCAAWNDRVDVIAGTVASPAQIRLRLAGDTARGGTTLALEGYERGLSSWANLLHAYEDWALLDSRKVNEDFTRLLMESRPAGVDRAPVPPSAIYTALVHQVAPAQLRRIERLSSELGETAQSWLAPLREFWGDTFEAALDLQFPNVIHPVRANLRQLETVGTGIEDDDPPIELDREPVRAETRNGYARPEPRSFARRETLREPEQPARRDRYRGTDPESDGADQLDGRPPWVAVTVSTADGEQHIAARRDEPDDEPDAPVRRNGRSAAPADERRAAAPTDDWDDDPYEAGDR
jgi:hypothetical protein